MGSVERVGRLGQLSYIFFVLQNNFNNSNASTSASASPSIKIASDEVVEKFEKKMRQIELKEREIEAEKKAQALGTPYIDLRAFPIAQEALGLIPRIQAEQLRVVCFFFNQDQLRVATPDPKNSNVLELVHQLEERHHVKGGVYLISEESFKKAYEAYKRLPIVQKIVKGVTISEEDINKFKGAVESQNVLRDELKRVSVTDLVTVIVAGALKFGATDIHIEAEKERVVVRYRLDGILHDMADLPIIDWPKIISRIKLISGLKINVTDKPQDGRFSIKLTNEEIDVRVACLPTIYGESVVVRILRALVAMDIDKLGLQEQQLALLKRTIAMPHGMVISTGPTGSGKTTTLCAILKALNKPGVKIVTLEDPVEYRLEGINQSQIDPSHDFTFARGLRALLRQDPDVAMVGEIRDLETADTAINAALTGHLILSTIHTNSAAGAIPRFLSMGVKPFLLAPALRAVLGQRLVRILCVCKKQQELSSEEIDRLHKIFAHVPKNFQTPNFESAVFYTAADGGCEKCGNVGYKGRVGIYEIFEMSQQIAECISKGRISENEIASVAIEGGMMTMAQDGVFKAMTGITSLSEVFRAAE
jgi:type IV pilus assembly protein PilB